MTKNSSTGLAVGPQQELTLRAAPGDQIELARKHLPRQRHHRCDNKTLPTIRDVISPCSTTLVRISAGHVRNPAVSRTRKALHPGSPPRVTPGCSRAGSRCSHRDLLTPGNIRTVLHAHGQDACRSPRRRTCAPTCRCCACGSATGGSSSTPCRSPTARCTTEVSVAIAFRIAKVLDVSLHYVLTGTALPPGTYKHCGWANAE